MSNSFIIRCGRIVKYVLQDVAFVIFTFVCEVIFIVFSIVFGAIGYYLKRSKTG
jgi:hypothetical protein